MPQVLNLASQALGQVQNTPYYATVAAPAPASKAQPLNIVIPDIDDERVWTLTGWASGGSSMPQVGAVCIVAFDNRRNLRLLSWVDMAPMQVVHMTPSGDATGTRDDQAFNNAVAALSGGGVIYLHANSTPFYTKAGWTLPAQTTSGDDGCGPVCIQGLGMPMLCPVGNAITGIYYHRTSSFGNPQVNDWPSGYIRDIIVDGTYATGASVGIDVGDGVDYHIRAQAQNFTGTGAYGFNVANYVFWTEKNHFELRSIYNAAAVHHLDDGATSNSQEYNRLDYEIIAATNQQGVVVDGVSLGKAQVLLRGNFAPSSTSGTPTNNVAALSFINAGRLSNASLQLGAERDTSINHSGSGASPYTIYSDGTGYLQKCTGNITTQLGSGIKMNGAEFSFSGMIGKPDFTGTLSDLYPAPTQSGATPSWSPITGGGATVSGLASTGTFTWPNTGPDAYVRVESGTVSSIELNGVVTGATSGGFTVPAACSLAVVYTAAPTLTVIPLRVTQE